MAPVYVGPEGGAGPSPSSPWSSVYPWSATGNASAPKCPGYPCYECSTLRVYVPYGPAEVGVAVVDYGLRDGAGQGEYAVGDGGEPVEPAVVPAEGYESAYASAEYGADES